MVSYQPDRRLRRTGIFKNRHSDSNDDPACSRHSTTHAGLTQVEQLIIQKLELDAKGVDQLLEETGLTMSQLMEGILALQPPLSLMGSPR